MHSILYLEIRPSPAIPCLRSVLTTWAKQHMAVVVIALAKIVQTKNKHGKAHKSRRNHSRRTMEEPQMRSSVTYKHSIAINFIESHLGTVFVIYFKLNGKEMEEKE